MGHATRYLAVMIALVGVALIVWRLSASTGPTTLSAEFSSPEDSNAAPSPPIASFPSRGSDEDETPLHVEFLGIEPHFTKTARDRISMRMGSREIVHHLEKGAELILDGERFTISDIRTWQGLLPIDDGTPMVSISILDEATTPIENILLHVGQRLEFGSELSVELRDCSSREDALNRVSAEPDGPPEGRWGVADTTGIIWFESFTPGTGATLMDGSLITLESFDPSGPTLVVRKRSRNGDELLRQVGATLEPPLLLEHGAPASRVTMYAFADGHVLATTGRTTAELASGETWTMPDGRALRIEQALLSAAPVEARQSPFFEAVLVSSDSRVRVRQGEAVRMGDWLLRYMREPDHQTAAFRLRTTVGSESREILLTPGAAHAFDWAGRVWRIRHDAVEPRVRLTIERSDTSHAPVIVGGAFAVAAIALWWMNTRRQN